MNSESEINFKLEIDRLQKLLDEKTQKLEETHLEIASLVNFICKIKNIRVSADEKQTPDGQDVIPQSNL